MKLYDQKTMDLARVVQDVLEGKKVVKEMDPTDHVSKKDDKYVVVNKAGKEVKSFDSEDDANQYAKDNHDTLMEVEVAYKKDRERLKDGSNDKKVTNLRPESVQEAHEEALAINEARQLKDPKTEVMVVKNGKVEVIDKKDLKKFMKMGYGLAEDTITISLPALFNEAKATIDLDFADGGDKEMKRIEKKYKVKYKKRKDGGFDVTGDTKALQKLLKGDEYAYDKDDIEDMFPEVLEAKDVKKEEMSAKQKAYKKVFDGALKKFGVKSPAELEGDKKKEFFDYVDANYEADNETDIDEGIGDFFNRSKKKKAGVDKDKTAAAITTNVDKDMIKKYKDKVANAKAKADAADKRGDKDKEDYWLDVLFQAEKDLDELESGE